MTDTKLKKLIDWNENEYSEVFEVWLRNDTSNSKIQYGRSNMVDQNVKIYLTGM